MNVKKYLSAVLMCALIILQILPATFAAADFVSLKWISPSSTDPQEIFNGQSAVFRVQIIAPGPITPSIQLYDTTKGSVVKTFSGGTFTTPKFYEAEFTIDNSIYGAGDFPKKYSVVVGGTYKDAKGKTYDIPAERIYLSVNKKPLRFSSNIPDITLNEDARYTTSPLTYYFDYDEGDYEKLSFSSSDVQDISVSMVGNRATLTPRENFNGARSISFILTNGETTVYSNTAKITVNPINDAPVITTSSLPKATVGNPYSQKIEANDIEGDSLTFSLIDSPVGMSIGSSNGVISWTPSAAGNYNIKIKVTDNGKNPDALSTEKAFTIEAVEPDNKSPVINSFTVDSTSKLGESDFTFTVSANDPDGDSSRLKYEFDADGKAGYEIDNANSNVLTRKFSKGDYTIGVRVTDIRGGTATASLQITASNNAPTIKSSTPSGSKVTITEKSTQEFSVIAEDKDVNDKDKLAYSWKLNGKEVSTSQSYKLETDYNSAGDYTLDVTVSDGTARAVKSWEVHVTDMNQIPLILEYNPSASKVTINEGESKIFSVYEARDLDGDALSYKWNLNGKQLPASENSYTFSADYKSAGDYSLSVAVSDGKSDSVPVSWEIYVNDVNTAPSIVLSGYTSITDEQELLLIVSSSDAEGDEIRFKEPKTLITGYTFTDLSTTQKLFKWRPLKGTGGTFPIRFEADDGKAIGFTDANIIVTTVTPKNNPPIADFTFSPASPKVNEVVTFTSTSKDNDAGDFISSYAWDFNSDGKTDASTQIATYKFAAEGTYNAKLNVTDSKGASSSTIKSVTVIKTLTTNNPPVADFTFSPLSPKTGDAVSFTSKASDPDGDAITHAWDFNSDGIIDSTLTAPTYTYNAEGTYNAKLNVTDSKGASSSTIKSITVIKTPTTNNPPVADFTFSPATPSVNEQVQFDGSPSSDADNDALSYSWIFESGKTSNEVKPKYAFTKDGSYDVNLTVAETNTADKKSNSIVKRVTVRRIDVANTNPIADFSFSPANPKVGDTVSFISTSKDNDAGDYIREYNWDTNGDGGTDSTISTASMIFTTAGTYNARLTVVDSRGASNSVVKQVVVSSYQNNPPIADFSFSPANPKVGDTVSFISTSRDNDPADYIIHFSWDLNNDGIQDANLPTASYTYSSAGTFNAKLTVTDSHGAINSVVRQVVVSSGTPSPNNPPVADFTYIPANPASGQEVTFTSTSTDTDGDSVSVKWDLNNDGVIDSTSNIVKYTFSAQGTYPIKLTATDSKSASSSVTKSIVVGPKPKLEITSLNCFDVVVKDAKQSCSAEVKAGGQLVGDASVKIYFSDGSSFGQCNSDSITGACRVSDKVMTQLGSYTVYATAEKAGHDSDLDKQPTFLFRVIKHRYDIISLQLYSDQNFISEDYDYFRGENLYARFKVKDLTTNQFVNNGIVTEVALVSRPGGNVSLTDMGIAGDFYRYKLTPIPLTHGFKGESQVFTFAFNFADDSGGEKDVQLVIRNNPPKINGNIPDVTCSVGKTCELPLSEFDYNSDKEDSGDNLKWAVSGVNTNLFDAVIDGKSLKITGKDKGNDEVTLTLYDLDRDSDSDNINVEITKPVLEITKLRCFENVIVNENQSCSVFVKADNQPIGNTDVSLYFSDGTSFGQCKTDRISGGCEAQRTMLSVGNNYEVYAVADKSGYDSDDDKQPRFAFRVLKHRYDIENLKVFNDAGFAQEDYDFFRGENLYAQFRVKDLTTGNYVTNVITRATLVSEPGGREDLSKYGMNGEFYRYSLTPIPLTHEFKGDSQVFTFAFNFADSSGGQKEVNLVIRNNPPEIRGEILFECMLGTVCLKNLDVNEFDREDRGINLTWTLKSYDSNIISAKLDGKMLIVKPLNHGTANLLLALTDLDNDTVSKVGTITVSNRGVVLEPIGSKFVSEGQTLQFVVAASDNDNDVIKLSAASLPKGAEFDTVSRAGNVKQIFTWTPSFAQSGTYVVRFQATDGVSIVYEDVTIKVGEQSLKPIFSSTPITQIEWGKDYVYDANAYDPDGVVVKYQLMQAPNGMLINQFTGVVTWQPTFKDIGSHQVVIQAVDDSGLTAEQDYVLTVISEPGSLRKKLDVGDISFPKNLASYGSGDLLPVEITFTNDGKVPLTTTAATIALYDSYQDLVSSPKRVLLSIPAGKTVTKRVYIELPDELDSDAEYYLRVTSTDINSGGSFSNPLYFSK